jgi:hypothetical protein
MVRSIIPLAALLTWAAVAPGQLVIDRDTTLDYVIGPFEPPIDILNGLTGATTVEVVEGANIAPNIHVRNESVLNMRGGILGGFLVGHDASTINIYGGLVASGEDIEANDRSTVNVFGGIIGDDLEAKASSTVHLYGGHIGGTLGVQRDGIMHVYLRSFEVLPPDGISPLDQLRGILSDGSDIHVTLSVDSVDLNGTRIELHTVPEPFSLAFSLISAAIMFLTCRRSRQLAIRKGGLNRGSADP